MEQVQTYLSFQVIYKVAPSSLLLQELSGGVIFIYARSLAVKETNSTIFLL